MISTHPETVIIGIALAIFFALEIIVWCSTPSKVIKCYPRETLRDKLAFRIYSLPKLVQPWAEALHTVMETCHLVTHVYQTEREFSEMQYRFACVLSDATNGQMSKTNYDKDTMAAVIQEAQQTAVNDWVVDALADLPNFEFPWARVLVLCQYLEVSHHDVSERRKQKRQMAKLVAKTRKERKAATKLLLDNIGDTVCFKATPGERVNISDEYRTQLDAGHGERNGHA